MHLWLATLLFQKLEPYQPAIYLPFDSPISLFREDFVDYNSQD